MTRLVYHCGQCGSNRHNDQGHVHTLYPGIDYDEEQAAIGRRAERLSSLTLKSIQQRLTAIEERLVRIEQRIKYGENE